MKQNEFETMKKKLSSGEFDGLSIRVVNTPRYLVKISDQEIWLDGKHGLSTRRDYAPGFILNKLRDGLTTSDIGESFAYIAADRVTSASEKRTLHLNLSHYGVDSYTGVLVANELANHITKSELDNQSPEAIIGLETVKQNRIIFNLTGSAPCTDRKGYDRVMFGEFAAVYLNSETGEYLAEKTAACKALYAPLAHLKPSDIADEDLVKALSFAPTEEIYQA